MATPVRIGITTGDPDGIGTEVVSKALHQLGPQRGVQFFIWRSPQCVPRHLKRLDKKFKRIVASDWSHARNLPKLSGAQLVDICSSDAPAFWVQSAAVAAHENQLDALVTGPLSKTSIIESGLQDIGHTSILKRVSGTPDVFMGFFGQYFNVTLVTDHLPLSHVPHALTAQKIELAAGTLAHFMNQQSGAHAKKPIGVLGLNPHAGEGRLLGMEEADVILPVIKKLQREGLKIAGPLVPDAAFLKQNWLAYSAFLALYHDQGLIPFKAFHGQQSGVHISLGLPFIRTSVDHGTAKDIFGREIADERSMVEALEWGIRLAREKQKREKKMGPLK